MDAHRAAVSAVRSLSSTGPANSAIIIASTAICGLTFSSMASRQASTASSRCSAPTEPRRDGGDVDICAATSGFISGAVEPRLHAITSR